MPLPEPQTGTTDLHQTCVPKPLTACGYIPNVGKASTTLWPGPVQLSTVYTLTFACVGSVLHSSPKVMAVFLFLIFENFLIGGMFSILETIKTDKSTLILQNKNWYQMINPMCATFQMWQNCILQNQVSFERLISLSKTPYIFVKISNPRNWDPYSIFVMSHGNRTSSYETVAHKLRQSVAAVHSSPKVMAVSSNIKMNMLDLLNFYDIYPVHQRHVCLDVVKM